MPKQVIEVRTRPILFSAPMIRAILAGQKTVTRRIVKPQPPARVQRLIRQNDGAFVEATLGDMPLTGDWSVTCPYGKPGDRLRVSESHQLAESRITPRLVECVYEADEAERDVLLTKSEWAKFKARKNPYAKLSGRYMFRSLSRITLEVTDLRVERVQNISDADCYAEGIDAGEDRSGPDGKAFAAAEHAQCGGVALELGSPERHAFAALWEHINSPESWTANPWVWVISFRRIDQ